MSNGQALDLFRACKPAYMSHLLLSHLSAENNCPKLARALFVPHAGGTEVVVASRFAETPVYAVGGTAPGCRRAGSRSCPSGRTSPCKSVPCR